MFCRTGGIQTTLEFHVVHLFAHHSNIFISIYTGYMNYLWIWYILLTPQHLWKIPEPTRLLPTTQPNTRFHDIPPSICWSRCRVWRPTSLFKGLTPPIPWDQRRHELMARKFQRTIELCGTQVWRGDVWLVGIVVFILILRLFLWMKMDRSLQIAGFHHSHWSLEAHLSRKEVSRKEIPRRKQDEAHEPECRHVTYVDKQRQYLFVTFPANSLVRHPEFTHWGDTFVRHFFLDTLTWHSCKTLLLDTLARQAYVTLLLDTLVRHSCKTLLLDTLVRHSYLTLL